MPNEDPIEDWQHYIPPPEEADADVATAPANDLDPFAGALTKNKKVKPKPWKMPQPVPKLPNNVASSFKHSWTVSVSDSPFGGAIGAIPTQPPSIPQPVPLPPMPSGGYYPPILDPPFPPPYGYETWRLYFNSVVQDYGDLGVANRRFVDKANYLLNRYHQMGQYGLNSQLPITEYALPPGFAGEGALTATAPMGAMPGMAGNIDLDQEEIPVPQIQNGPVVVAQKKDRTSGNMTCQTCGYAHPADQFMTTADDVKICKRCYQTFGHCGFCGFTPKLEEFKVREYVHANCPDCAPTRKTKLNIKQRREFEPKRDLLGARRERVWPQISR